METSVRMQYVARRLHENTIYSRRVVTMLVSTF